MKEQNASPALVLLTEFFCSSQVARSEGKKPRHPIEVVNELI